jgi:hypothetical protein
MARRLLPACKNVLKSMIILHQKHIVNMHMLDY